MTKSCQIYILIEMSKEMFQFDSEGYLQTEKCEHFLRSYFERCKADGSTHEVVVILYARLFYPQKTDAKEVQLLLNQKGNAAFQVSNTSKLFQDVYLKVGVVTLDTSRNTWNEFMI